MEYKYITNQQIEIPKVVYIQGIPKLECIVNCVSGIVGDTYGFEKIDVLTLYTDLTLTIIQVQESLKSQCEQFVSVNYPPTN